MLSTLSQYVIPRKVTVQQSEELKDDEFRFVEIPSTSEKFKEVFAPVIISRLSPYGLSKSSAKVLDCYSITNPKLEKKFETFRSKLSADGAPSDISYAFMIVGDNPREIDIIAKDGLWTGNVPVGDLGIPKKGIYLSESPDLTTPAPFIDETTTLRVFAFKVLKGKTKSVTLGSYEIEPTQGFNSHVPVTAPEPSLLTRHELYRYNQIYLFELFDSERFATRPSNVLPFAVYKIEFAFSLKNLSKKVPVTVWKGHIAIKDRIYGGLQMISPLGVSIKPFLLQACMKIDQLVDWAVCVRSPLMVELLAVPLVGELAIKKELVLKRHQRFVTYFIVEPEENNVAFSHFSEFMRIQSLAAFVNLDGFSSLILIPNGFLSSLLALPFKPGGVFHCIYVSPLSLLHGHFIPFSSIETTEFDSDPLLGEKVDGIDEAIHRIAREVFPSEWLKKGSAIDDEDSSPTTERVQVLRPDMTPESHSPVDMDVEQPQEEIKPVQATLCSRPGDMAIETEKSKGSETVQKTSVQVSQRAPDPRRKRRLQVHKDLPLPKLSEKSTEVKPLTGENSQCCTKSDMGKSKVNLVGGRDSNDGDVPLIVRCHIPYDEPSGSLINSTNVKKSTTDIVSDETINVNEIESPASPPPEDSVYVAPASKIIPVSNEQNRFDMALEGSLKIYRAPQISLFPETMKNFQLSDAGVKALQQLSQLTSEASKQAESTNLCDKVRGESLKSDEDERLRLASNLPIAVKNPHGTEPLSHPPDIKGSDELIRASSKDVDLRFINLSTLYRSSGVPSCSQRSSETSDNDNKVLELSTPFVGANEDRDERILLSLRTKKQVYGSCATRTTSCLSPSTSKTNDTNADNSSVSSTLPCNFSFPPPSTSRQKWNSLAANLNRPPPPVTNGQNVTTFAANLKIPPRPLTGSLTRLSLTKNTQISSTGTSNSQTHPTLQTSSQTFGFFNLPVPKPRISTSSFPKHPSVGEKPFFPQGSFPPVNLSRPRLQGSAMHSQLSARPSSMQVSSSCGPDLRTSTTNRSVVHPDDHRFFKGPT